MIWSSVSKRRRKSQPQIVESQIETPETTPTVRLQKYLARAGAGSSRRAVEQELMPAGRVTVNGKVATKLGTKINPDIDVVTVDGKEVHMDAPRVTIALNKPKGVMTTMADPQKRPCVADYVPLDSYPSLFHIVRLDFDTTGLLLLTTDGELGNALLHPSHHVDKTYRAVVEGTPDDEDIKELRKGVLIDDGSGSYLTAPARVRVIQQGAQSTLTITIHEGKNRQVRKMLDTVGHPVIQLERVQFGAIELGNLPVGSWRVLTVEEEAKLYSAAGLR